MSDEPTTTPPAPEPSVSDTEIAWPPPAKLAPADMQGFAWTMATQSAQIRALTDAGDMLYEQNLTLKAERDALTKERDGLKAIVEADTARLRASGQQKPTPKAAE